MKLTGKQYEELTKILECAYPSEEELKRMLRFGLNKILASITAKGNLRDQIFEVVGLAETEGWLNVTLRDKWHYFLRDKRHSFSYCRAVRTYRNISASEVSIKGRFGNIEVITYFCDRAALFLVKAFC